jgi:hypothetical protein
VLADEGDGVFSYRNGTVDIFISLGLLGWSKVWDRCERDSKPGNLASAKATSSGSETRLSSESTPQITSILVNMTLEHLNNSTNTRKESNL